MEALVEPSRSQAGVFAPPREVARLEDCYFYHTMDLPGFGTVRGPWDIRGYVDAYLGGVDLRGRRVLEIGAASGFFSVEMQRRGADVVAFDLSDEFDGNVVTFCGALADRTMAARQAFVRRMNNAWWLAQRATGSSAKMAHGTAYDVPQAVGEVDVVTFGCVLLHLRDPYRALASAARLAREAVVVTEHPAHWQTRFDPLPMAPLPPPPPEGIRGKLLRLAHRLLGDRGWRAREAELRRRALARETSPLDLPAVLFLPTPDRPEQTNGWWCFRPEAAQAMLGTMGFARSTVTHTVGPRYNGSPERVFTVVARRG
jgi:SAM-dependent methyltransferase